MIASLAFSVSLAAPLGLGRGLAEEGVGDDPPLVRGDDGCWYDEATGEISYCENEIVDVPPPHGGLIPGEDGCLYFPDGVLAECPEGSVPTDGGCTPHADRSPGCVVPGPIGGINEGPAPVLPPPDEVPAEEPEPAPVVDPAPAAELPAVEPPVSPGEAANEVSDGQVAAPAPSTDPPTVPTDVAPIAEGAPAFDPGVAADRIRSALAPVGAWLAVLLGWLLQLVH